MDLVDAVSAVPSVQLNTVLPDINNIIYKKHEGAYFISFMVISTSFGNNFMGFFVKQEEVLFEIPGGTNK